MRPSSWAAAVLAVTLLSGDTVQGSTQDRCDDRKPVELVFFNSALDPGLEGIELLEATGGTVELVEGNYDVSLDAGSTSVVVSRKVRRDLDGSPPFLDLRFCDSLVLNATLGEFSHAKVVLVDGADLRWESEPLITQMNFSLASSPLDFQNGNITSYEIHFNSDVAGAENVSRAQLNSIKCPDFKFTEYMSTLRTDGDFHRIIGVGAPTTNVTLFSEVDGRTAIKVDWTGIQHAVWGGGLSIVANAPDITYFNFSQAGAIRYDYKVDEPESAPGRSHFRVQLADASEHFLPENRTKGMEVYYSFFHILNEGSDGWNAELVALQGDDKLESNFYLTGWTGAIADKVLSTEVIAGIRLEFSMDGNGEINSTSNGTLFLSNFTATCDSSFGTSGDLPCDMFEEVGTLVEQDHETVALYKKFVAGDQRCCQSAFSLSTKKEEDIYFSSTGGHCTLYSAAPAGTTGPHIVSTAKIGLYRRTPEEGICDRCVCNAGKTIVDCTNQGFTAFPVLTQDESFKIEELDLSHNPIGIVSSSLITYDLPRLRVLSMRNASLGYFGYDVLQRIPNGTQGGAITSLNLEDNDELWNIYFSPDGSNEVPQFINPCMEQVGSLLQDSVKLIWAKTVEDETQRDCDFIPHVTLEGSTLWSTQAVFKESDTKYAYSAASKEACCELCTSLRNCEYFMLDQRDENAENSCGVYLDDSKEKEVSPSSDVVGYWKGVSPLHRYLAGDTSGILVSAESNLELHENDNFTGWAAFRLSGPPSRGTVWIQPNLIRDEDETLQVEMDPPVAVFDAETWNQSIIVRLTATQDSTETLSPGTHFSTLMFEIKACDSAFMEHETTQHVYQLEIVKVDDAAFQTQLLDLLLRASIILVSIGVCFLTAKWYMARTMKKTNLQESYAGYMSQQVAFEVVASLLTVADIISDFGAAVYIWFQPEFAYAANIHLMFSCVAVLTGLYDFYKSIVYMRSFRREVGKIKPVHELSLGRTGWESVAMTMIQIKSHKCGLMIMHISTAALEDAPMLVLNSVLIMNAASEGINITLFLSILASAIGLGAKMSLIATYLFEVGQLKVLLAVRKIGRMYLSDEDDILTTYDENVESRHPVTNIVRSMMHEMAQGFGRMDDKVDLD